MQWFNWKKVQDISDSILSRRQPLLNLVSAKVLYKDLVSFSQSFSDPISWLHRFCNNLWGRQSSSLFQSDQTRPSLRKYLGDVANKRPLPSYLKFWDSTAFQELVPVLYAQNYIVQTRKIKRPQPPKPRADKLRQINMKVFASTWKTLFITKKRKTSERCSALCLL